MVIVQIARNVTELTVAIVSEDTEVGAEFAEKIKGQLPFKVKSDLTLDQAKDKLDEHDLSMVVHIPAPFYKQLIEARGAGSIKFLHQ